MIGHLYHRLPDVIPEDGEFQVFESTADTRSNWGPEIQHGSPPLALLTKLIEEQAPAGMRIGRLTLDLLGAIPVAPLKARAWVSRPGSRIAMMTAELTPVDGTRPVGRVTAWLIATSDTRDAATDRHPPIVEGPALAKSHAWEGAPGYLETIDWRKQPDDGASAVGWLTPLVPLVDAEPTTALQRLAMVVDSANGLGAALDPQRFVFMNTDTVVHLHRLPEGSDFALRARGSIGPDGVGVTTAELYDRRGYIGTSAQTLLVQRNP